MNKKAYFKISEENDLPKRCPLLGICERRAHSIFLLSYSDEKIQGKTWSQILIDKGELSNDFENTKIKIQGESPGLIKGNDSFNFYNLCPEVNLFDNSHSISSNKTAWTSISYDKYFSSDNKYIVSEYRHFSDCTEFCKYAFDNKNADKYYNKNTINKNDLKQLVVENLEKAMQTVYDNLSQSHNKGGFNQIITIKLSYQNLKNKEIAGTISLEQEILVKSQLTQQLLNLIDLII